MVLSPSGHRVNQDRNPWLAASHWSGAEAGREREELKGEKGPKYPKYEAQSKDGERVERPIVNFPRHDIT